MSRRPPLREDLAHVDAYRAPQLEAPVRLNTNESPYPLPEGFAEELAATVRTIAFNRYPERDATALRKALAEHAGHPAGGVWVANGSNEVIQHLCLAYGGPGRRALVFEPTYALHSLIPRVTGMEVVVDRLGDGFRLAPGHAERAMDQHRPAITFVCSPNNPTGTSQLVAAVEVLCEHGEGLVVVDEAYGEFGGVSSALLLERFENLAVVRTFSKAFALAAARIGYCLADAALVDELARVRLPYHLSTLTQAAGEVALRYAEDAAELLARVRVERDRLLDGLGRIPTVEVSPSEANFVLFRTPAVASSLWHALLDRGVLVRDVSSGVELERCLRVSAGTPEEVDAFLEAMPDALVEVGV